MWKGSERERPPPLVEHLAHYSRSLSMLYDLRMVLQVTASGVNQTAERPSSMSEKPSGGAQRVRERLSPEDKATLVAKARDGVPKTELSRRFGISHSSVKRPVIAPPGTSRAS